MDLHLADKTVIVTGAGSNIGRAIAIRFAEENANIVIAELDEQQGKKVAEIINGMGKGKAICVKTDVTDIDQVAAMVQQANDNFGKVDVLVNNVAGAGGGYDQLFMEEEVQKWRNLISITYFGVINCTRAVLDQMIEKKSGVIVNIGSDAGRMGEYKEAVYSGCKGAVIAFTKALARELGRYSIRLNVVCPGLTVPQNEEEVGDGSCWSGGMLQIFTPEAQQKAAKAYPLRKLGRADDIANSVVFVASDRAGHVTGQTLSVSGGYTMM